VPSDKSGLFWAIHCGLIEAWNSRSHEANAELKKKRKLASIRGACAREADTCTSQRREPSLHHIHTSCVIQSAHEMSQFVNAAVGAAAL